LITSFSISFYLPLFLSLTTAYHPSAACGFRFNTYLQYLEIPNRFSLKLRFVLIVKGRK
jgi:hypothetical protein